MVISETLQIPLTQDERGVIRVRGTRVPLKTMIFAFKQGDTAEEIAQKYPVLNLADIYAVIAYYLAHQEWKNDSKLPWSIIDSAALK